MMSLYGSGNFYVHRKNAPNNGIKHHKNLLRAATSMTSFNVLPSFSALLLLMLLSQNKMFYALSSLVWNKKESKSKTIKNRSLPLLTTQNWLANFFVLYYWWLSLKLNRLFGANRLIWRVRKINCGLIARESTQLGVGIV